MAVKTQNRMVIILLLCVMMLLTGCAEKNQTVSETPERSDVTIVVSSTSEIGVENTNGETGKEVSLAVTTTVGQESTATTALSTAGTGSGNDNQAEKTEDIIVASATGTETRTSTGKVANSIIATVTPEIKIVTETTPVSSTEEKQKGAAVANASSDPVEIKFAEMYGGSSSRGLQFSEKMKSLDGKKVVMTGYMAPPLKPSLTFFVLTRSPMAICPFCDSDASWPEDIVLIYMPKGKSGTPSDAVIRVTGTLELGSHTDPDTGFVSQARIYSDTVEIVR